MIISFSIVSRSPLYCFKIHIRNFRFIIFYKFSYQSWLYLPLILDECASRQVWHTLMRYTNLYIHSKWFFLPEMAPGFNKMVSISRKLLDSPYIYDCFIYIYIYIYIYCVITIYNLYMKILNSISTVGLISSLHLFVLDVLLII